MNQYWFERLRETTLEQGHGALILLDGKVCAMGAILAPLATPEKDVHQLFLMMATPGKGLMNNLPIVEDMKFQNEPIKYDGEEFEFLSHLIFYLNDVKKLSFKQIADIIEPIERKFRLVPA